MKKVKFPEKEAAKIFRKYGVAFAYLFGSQVKGTALTRSDYDIAVYLIDKNSSKRFDKRLKMMAELSRLFGPCEADVIILNDTHSVLLRYEAVVLGRLIYDKTTPLRIDYELNVFNEYEYMEPFLTEFTNRYLSLA